MGGRSLGKMRTTFRGAADTERAGAAPSEKKGPLSAVGIRRYNPEER
jgi:hypothetical protein